MGEDRIAFDHIAIAVERVADAPAVLVGQLGGVPHSGIAYENFAFGQWRFQGGGRIEVIEPRGEESFVRRFLAKRGPGIHHVTFRVPSLRGACDRAEVNGYSIVGYDDSNPHWMEAFLHPKQALGIVVQLAESKRSAGGERPRRWQPPPGPANPPAPVTILGLRMRAHSRERAQTQWGSALAGECTEGPGGELVYRWPGSPLRLVVEVDPARHEGPLCIEFVTDRPISLPDGRHPLLGAVFMRQVGEMGS